MDRRYFDNQIPVQEAVKIKNPVLGISERLKNARKQKGWSQNELAMQAGVNQPIVNRVEFGEKLTEKQGRKLAEALEVGFEWLMYGNEEKRNYPVDERMINWLWEHEEERKSIWEKMKD